MERNLHFVTLIIVFIFNVMMKPATSNYSPHKLRELHPGYGTDWMYFPNGNGTPTVVYLKSPHRSGILLPSESDVERAVTFNLYTRKENRATILPPEKLVESFSKIDFSKDTKIITHGFISSGLSDTCQDIKNAYLENHDVNVIILDWGELAANIFYFIPAANTQLVGAYYGKFLDRMIENGANASKIHIIGHSLGAHVSGYAGKSVTKGKLGRITGLDPALPGFVGTLLTPLAVTNADYVDIIHTCGDVLGIYAEMGHADFYPNGGKPPQPGCGGLTQVVEACSHGRSWKYFAESINNKNKFVAKKCSSWDKYRDNTCEEEFAFMGEPVSLKARGSYYLNTKAVVPYAEPDKTTIKNNSTIKQ